MNYITSKITSIFIFIKLCIISVPSYLSFCVYGNRSSWYIFTHTTVFERLLLYRLALQQPSGATIVEIGSYLGASTCFLAAAVKKIDGGATLHCVDTWENDAMTEGSRDTWGDFQRNTRQYGDLIVPHRGRAEEIGNLFNKRIDLLFVDGDHSYEGCRRDVLTWLPYLNPGGIIVMHDYGWAEGVRQVVGELINPQQFGKGHVLQNTYWTRVN